MTYLWPIKKTWKTLLTIEDHIKRRRSPEITQEDNTSFPCAEGSLNVFDLSRPCHPSTSAEGRFVAHELEKGEGTIIEEGNNRDVWSTSGDFLCRHTSNKVVCPNRRNALHCHPIRGRDEADANANFASGHAGNDCWSEESDISHSEEFVGTTRFQILRNQLSERYK